MRAVCLADLIVGLVLMSLYELFELRRTANILLKVGFKMLELNIIPNLANDINTVSKHYF